MSILKSVAAVLQGMGPAGARFAKVGQVTVPAAPTLTLTLNEPVNCGWVRIQAKGFTTGGGFVSAVVTGTDTTTPTPGTWSLGSENPATAGVANSFASIMIPFICDNPLAIINVALAFTAAGTGGSPQLDAEVFGALM